MLLLHALFSLVLFDVEQDSGRIADTCCIYHSVESPSRPSVLQAL